MASSKDNNNNTNTIMEIKPEQEQESIAEAVLAAQWNVPRASFKSWRESGALQPGVHYRKDGPAYLLLPAGVAAARQLIGLPEAPPEPVRLAVRVQAAGAMPRILRAKPADGEGGMVSVRLTAPRVFATQFRRNDLIEVLPTEVDGIFEFDGPAPRRTRI